MDASARAFQPGVGGPPEVCMPSAGPLNPLLLGILVELCTEGVKVISRIYRRPAGLAEIYEIFYEESGMDLPRF